MGLSKVVPPGLFVENCALRGTDAAKKTVKVIEKAKKQLERG
jgi:hypothetical protein